ncbi:glycosyltransferase family 4 protein [Thermococcus sp.]
MEGLKIAIASDWFYPKVGGIESHIDELARNLLHRGHNPYVITHDYRYMRPYVDSFPYPVIRFSGTVYFRKYHVSTGVEQVWRINEFYKREGFDITHVHSIYSPLAIATSAVSRGLRHIPVVATNHSFYGASRYFDVIFGSILRKNLDKIDTFVAVSSPVARDTRELLGKNLKDRHVLVLPNGIDVEKWRPPEPEERERARKHLGLKDEIVILYLGRMTERKQAHRIPFMLREALEISGIPRRKVRLIMVGSGPMKSVLEKNLRTTGIGDITDLYGFMERGRLLPLYWASDIVLMPGILEAFPVVGLEAMATGRMVIGRNESGLSDMVVNGVTGLLATSEGEMAKSIAWALTNPELVRVMGEEGRKVVEEKFSWDVILSRLLEIYRFTLELRDNVDRRYAFYKLVRGLK